MKKMLFFVAAIISLTVVSCRQQEDILSPQDVATLKVIQNSSTGKTTTPIENNITTATTSSMNDTLDLDNDGDPAPPPKK